MNILLLTHIFPPAIDGGSRVIHKLGDYFLSKNNRVVCLTTNCQSTDDFVNPKSKPLRVINENRIITYRLPVYKFLRKPLKIINLFIPKSLFLHDLIEVFQKGPFFKIIPFINTIRIIRQNKPDLIIAGPLPTTIAIYSKWLAKFYKAQLLINASFHQTDYDFYKKPLIKSLKKSNYIWTLTSYESKYLKEKFHINSSRLILAGNGIDQNFLIKPNNINFPSQPNLLFIGSLASHKRVELLIQSFGEILKITPGLTLTIAGQKTLYYPNIERKLNRLPKEIRNKINLVFNFPQIELLKLIDQSSLLILPSVQESFGLVLIEAWARGKPVVCTDIPPLKELINKSNGGLIFRSDSLDNLTETIVNLIKNPDLGQKLGKNGYEYVKNNYTWEKVGNKICQKICS